MSGSSDRETPARRVVPGDWYAVLGSGAVVLLPPAEKRRVAAVWSLVDEGAGFDEVLDALISDGLRDLTGFALLGDRDGEVRVVIRGGATAVLATRDGEVRVEGAAAVTWAEREVHGVTSLRVEVDEVSGPVAVPAEPSAADSLPLVMRDGLTRASAVLEPALADTDPDGSAVVAEPESDVGPGAEVGPDAQPDPRPDPQPDPQPDADHEPTQAWTPPTVPPVPAPPFPPEDQPTQAVPGLDAEPQPDSEPAPDPDPEPAPAPPQARVLPPMPPGWRGPDPAPTADPDTGTDTGTDAGTDAVTDTDPDPRPVAVLMVSTGEAVEVEGAVLFGRSPNAEASDSPAPRLVTLPSPSREISGTHLEIRPGAGDQAGSAVVTDLGSTNGTVVVQPGAAPSELPVGVPVVLEPGSVLDLGDGISIEVEEP